MLVRARLPSPASSLLAVDGRTGHIDSLAGDTPRGGEYAPYPAIQGDTLFVGGPAGYYALRAR